MKETTKKEIKNYLGSTEFSNIIAIITLVVTIIFGVLAYVLPKATAESTYQIDFGLNSSAIIVFLLMIAFYIINFCYSKKLKNELRKYEIIKILSDLQNKYILEPEFKSSGEHSNQSKEKNLHDHGDARILTNSLNYDIFYCDAIAENIIKGARYIYVLPSEFQTLNDLKSYIKELYDNLFKQMNNANGENPTENAVKVLSLLENNLEFWFFDKEILCLYNFARFNQIGNPNFIQSWWYVNPVDHKDTSYMLAHEIDSEDQTKLNQVFVILQKMSVIFNGEEIFENKTVIDSEFIERRR